MQMLKENLVTLKVAEAMQKEKCPLCRLQQIHIEKYISNLIYEYTTDQMVVNKFINSLGFCTDHNQLLIKILKNNCLLSRIDVAKLYEKTIPLYLNTLEKEHNENLSLKNILSYLLHIKKNIINSNINKKTTECMCCIASDDIIRENSLTIIEILLQEEYRKLYKKSDGLCIPHFNSVIEFIRENGVVSPVKEFLVEDQIERLELLQYRLQSLQSKRNYYNKKAVSNPEVSSWYEAIWRFSGWKPEKLLL